MSLVVAPRAEAASQGLAYAWGDNGRGELGNGTTTDSSTLVPVRMPAGVTFTTISGGAGFSLALDSTGAAWAWGYNYTGQLGDGPTTWPSAPSPAPMDSDIPVAVIMPAGVTFTAVSAGAGYSLALAANGAAYAWGDLLGNGTTAKSSTPVPVTMPAGVTFTAISAGHVSNGGCHALALASSGAAYAWGCNGKGQLGNGTTTSSSTPVPVTMPAGVTFTAIADGHFHSLALASNGAGYAWGYNNTGQLGNGTTVDSSIPVPVSMPVGVTFTAIGGGGGAGGSFSVALASSGAAYAWGDNFLGQLGNGTTTSSSIPVAVSMPTGVTFTAIAVGGLHVLALATNGSAYAWAYNFRGQLGDGTTVDRKAPVAVSTSAGVTFAVIAAGDDHSLALLSSTSAIPKPTPSISTSASPTTGTAGVPIPNLSDAATFGSTTSGAPTGSVTFTLYSNATCTTAVPGVSGSGTISTSGGISTASYTTNWTPVAAGTYHWIASYAGDANYNGVTTGCGDSNEQITIAPPPSSFCVPGTLPTEVNCTLYESKAGALSELSDVVPIPNPPGAVPSGAVAIVQNPNLPQTDPTNWSDVVEFLPAIPGAPPGSPSQSVQQLSEGCGNPNNPFDVSCYPPASAITQFVVEVQSGQGNDFTDCTPFVYVFQGQPFGQINACSDAALNEAPNPDVPEAPLAPMLPLAALGVVVAGYGWRRRTSSRV